MSNENQCHEAPQLCVNNCGFFGSAATMNYCSKCFQQKQTKELISTPSTSVASSSSIISLENQDQPVILALTAAAATEQRQQQQVKSRCSECKKKVGLLGFRCRCGMTFCGTHRYPEEHACSFDFKEKGREQIASLNPVVMAEKVEKI